MNSWVQEENWVGTRVLGHQQVDGNGWVEGQTLPNIAEGKACGQLLVLREGTNFGSRLLRT